MWTKVTCASFCNALLFTAADYFFWWTETQVTDLLSFFTNPPFHCQISFIVINWNLSRIDILIPEFWGTHVCAFPRELLNPVWKSSMSFPTAGTPGISDLECVTFSFGCWNIPPTQGMLSAGQVLFLPEGEICLPCSWAFLVWWELWALASRSLFPLHAKAEKISSSVCTSWTCESNSWCSRAFLLDSLNEYPRVPVMWFFFKISF